MQKKVGGELKVRVRGGKLERKEGGGEDGKLLRNDQKEERDGHRVERTRGLNPSSCRVWNLSSTLIRCARARQRSEGPSLGRGTIGDWGA